MSEKGHGIPCTVSILGHPTGLQTMLHFQPCSHSPNKLQEGNTTSDQWKTSIRNKQNKKWFQKKVLAVLTSNGNSCFTQHFFCALLFLFHLLSIACGGQFSHLSNCQTLLCQEDFVSLKRTVQCRSCWLCWLWTVRWFAQMLSASHFHLSCASPCC